MNATRLSVPVVNAAPMHSAQTPPEDSLALVLQDTQEIHLSIAMVRRKPKILIHSWCSKL